MLKLIIFFVYSLSQLYALYTHIIIEIIMIINIMLLLLKQDYQFRQTSGNFRNSIYLCYNR